jgi:hypothetical protein
MGVEHLCQELPAPDLEPESVDVTDRENVTWEVVL